MNTGLPYNLDVKDADTFISRDDMVQVQNFAKDTGDFTSLSTVDTQVIAMGVRIARQKNEHGMIKSEP